MEAAGAAARAQQAREQEDAREERQTAVVEQVQLLVAEMLAENALVAAAAAAASSSGSGSGSSTARPSAHSAEVKTFHALHKLGRLMEDLTEPIAENAPREVQQRYRERIRLVQPTVEKGLKEILVGQLAGLCLSPSFYKLLGRLFRMLMERGDSRNIMAITNDLHDQLGLKSTLSAQSKTAVFYCLGEISSCKQGRVLAGHLRETTQLVARVFRSNAHSSTRPADNEYRFAAVRALGSALQGSEVAGRSNHAEALKVLVRAAADKSPPVRSAVADAALSLALVSDGFTSVALDQLVTLTKRGLEDRVAHVRSAFARSLGAILCLAVEMAGPLRALDHDTILGGPSGTASEATSSSSAGGSSFDATSTAAPKGVAAAARLAGLKMGVVGVGSSSAGAAGTGSADGSVSGSASGASTPSPRGSKLRGFGFAANFGGLGGRSKPEAPVSYSLDTALGALMTIFDAWAPDQLERRSDMANAQSTNEITQRSTEVRMATAEAAVEFFRYLQRTGDAEQQHLVISAAISFVRGICDDKRKISLSTMRDRARDDALRRAVGVFVIERALSAKLSESGKIELARQLLITSTKQHASASRQGSGDLKRRNSRTMASMSLAAQTDDFKHGPLLISACLSEAACLLSSLGDASRALHQELDFQTLLPLLEHRDAAVRLECCNLLYVCAITQPGYASRGILPLLQLVGLYQPELAMTLASGPPHNASPTELETFDTEADRTLDAIEGLVHALCAFVYSSSANGRPRSTSAEAFLQRENMLLPAAAHFVRHEVPNSSTALLSGDLKGIPENTSMALLGHAKSMIARQHDGSTRPTATARIASCGWDLVASLVTLGSAWCDDNLSQLFQAWQSSVEASIPALQKVAQAKTPRYLASDSVTEASLTCLRAALQAMVGFIRCNQPLLRDMPAVARAVTVLTEQVVQASRRSVRDLPFPDTFMGIHAALFDICAWLPRAELRCFKESLVIPLQSLSMAYFLGPAGRPEGAATSTALSSLLSSRSGLLKANDDVLETASLSTSSQAHDDGDADEPLGRKQWRFEEASPTSPSRELFMEARVLTSAEAFASAAALMTSLSCNASHAAVAATPRRGEDLEALRTGAVAFSADSLDLVDGVPVCGMVRIPAVKFAQNCIDAAVSFSAVVLTNLFDDTDRSNVVQYLFGMLKRRTGEAQSVVLHNGVAVLLAFLQTLAVLQAEIDPRKAPWVARIRSIFCVAIASPRSIVRCACATGLATLTRLAGAEVGQAAVQTLVRKLENGQSPPAVPGATGASSAARSKTGQGAANGGSQARPGTSGPPSAHSRAGVALALALIRREARMHDTRYVKNNLVYDMCKITAQPVRTSALHAWQAIVESAGIDVGRFVAPSLALINAHLLAVDGHFERGGYGAFRVVTGTMTCLARLANSLIEGLGPELVRPDVDAVRFLNIWEALRVCGADSGLQLELVRMVQQILLFHPALVMEHTCDRERVETYLWELITDAQGEVAPAVRMLALQALSLLTERMAEDNDPRADVARGALSLLAFELVVQASICQDWIVPPVSSLGYGAMLLARSTRPNQAAEPLFIQATNAAFRDTSGAAASAASGEPLSSDNYGTATSRDFVEMNGYERMGLQQGSAVAGLADVSSLCNVSAARRLALRNLLKFIGLSHMKMRPAEKKLSTWTAEELHDAAALTDWMRFFRAVMTGTTGALSNSHGASGMGQGLANDHGADFGDEDGEGEGDSDNDDANDGGPAAQISDSSGNGTATGSSSQDALANNARIGPVLEFCDRVLSKCSWETKALAVEGLLEVLVIARTYSFHCDLDQASRVLKKAQLPVRGQFLCMHIRELLTGASQAANGTVQSAEVPQLSIQGYCALVEIVRIFASGRDRHNPEESVLKQFEMQLTATLGPGLGRSASPLVLPFVGVLAVQLLVSGVSTSARRIVGLLLPAQLVSSKDEEDDDDNDDDDDDGGTDAITGVDGTLLEDKTDLEQTPSFVQAELLILRLVPLARLWLFAQGCDTISERAVRSTQTPRMLRSKPSRKKGIKASIEKALLEFMRPAREPEKRKDLVDAWMGVLRDVAKLAVPIDADKEHEADAFDLVDASDAIAVFPAYLNAAWVVGRALGTLAEALPTREVDQGLVLRTSLILAARARPMDWPPLALGTIFQTAALALPVANAGKSCDTLAIMVSVKVLRDEASFKIVHGDFLIRQAFHVIAEVVAARARRGNTDDDTLDGDGHSKAIRENDLDNLHRLIEAVLMPVQTVLGPELSSLVSQYAQSHAQETGLAPKARHTYTTGGSMVGSRNAILASVADRAIASIPTLAQCLPSECAEMYSQLLAWNAFACVKAQPRSELRKAALDACAQMTKHVQPLQASLLQWAHDAIKTINASPYSADDATDSKVLEATRELRIAGEALCHREVFPVLDKPQFNDVAESMARLLTPETSSSSIIVWTLAAVRGVCAAETTDTNAVRMLAGVVGSKIAMLVRSADDTSVAVGEESEDERLASQTVAAAAVLTLAKISGQVPELAQFAVLSSLSLAEGSGAMQRSESTRNAGRAALVHLVSTCAAEVRAFVQTSTPKASAALQESIKSYLAGTA
ncbi:HEAT repeat-containing protein 5B [Hondaea fermentalgiana]|uniref:HEAT repeat-containing protein 5B n=1 Tax=Hondaea fermentalgiana TaxID=2315210 RepID=A0A2R5GF44_9STRA|nr:HEAT repeat-containing protein 5B [Hondaea fermentalgiana]|eukprot:GBG26454.1 HEAT repeat-containing protein 5B [Hondaea fermentalgiana]